MRKLIAIITVIVMAFVANTAQAEIVVASQSQDNVRKYVTKSIPDVTEDEIAACFNAVKNGGEFTIKRDKVKIECDEEEMVVFRRLF